MTRAILTIPQACAATGLHKTSLYRYAAKGLLRIEEVCDPTPGIKHRPRTGIFQTELDRFMRSRGTLLAPEPTIAAPKASKPPRAASLETRVAELEDKAPRRNPLRLRHAGRSAPRPRPRSSGWRANGSIAPTAGPRRTPTSCGPTTAKPSASAAPGSARKPPPRGSISPCEASPGPAPAIRPPMTIPPQPRDSASEGHRPSVSGGVLVRRRGSRPVRAS
jgi:hypothetical protein